MFHSVISWLTKRVERKPTAASKSSTAQAADKVFMCSVDFGSKSVSELAISVCVKVVFMELGCGLG